MRRVALAAVALVALAGCGGEGSSGSATASGAAASATAVTSTESLDGKSFVSLSVRGHDMVGGTAITMKVADGSLSLNAGCNTMNGPAVVADGLLRFSGHPVQTMMACGDSKDAQDKWLLETFTTGLSATVAGGELTLSHGDLTIILGPDPSASSK